MRGRDSSAGSSAASSSHTLSASESSSRAGQVSSMLAAGASSMRDLPAAQLPHRVRAAYRRLPDWCPEFLWWQRLRGVWRPVLATLFLGLLFAAPLIWSREHQHLGSRRAGYRLVARFLHNAHGRPIYADATEDAAVPKWQLKARVRAAIVVLARDSDCEGVLRSMARMEQRFNAKFGYPYVFLNNDPFGAEFVNRTSAATTARTLYGVVPPEHWGYPSFVDPKAAAKARMDMLRHRVLYGDRESYHHMCRYYSGFFHLHPLLQEFDYYWRMEPDVHYYCDLDYDPFLYMQENRIKYGFVITIEELPATIPSLWATTQAFMAARSDLLPAANLLSFVRAQSGDYNLCHFWSNFELGDLNFFRSEAYKSYFDYLDRTGGFFFERWGDAPVHSLAAAMFLNSTEVHFFQDFGYRHNSYKHCPAEQRNNCHCDALEAVAFHTPSFGVCHRRWREFLAAEEAARPRAKAAPPQIQPRVGVWRSG
ncbi:Glycolipid 2-alpha-mannosyltransferase 2 [Coccomyxa sp. Obi]|nr:Glycolipid 2-alpha-mannosyltransferase 2 [Coccomyxa sp. Obi]